MVKISYSPNALIHPAFDERYTTWDGERVEVALTPRLRGDAFPYLEKYNQVLLANLIRVSGLRHEYHVAGKGTPLVVYSKNPRTTAKAKHYPTDMSLGVIAVEENRAGHVPLLTLYDAVDGSGTSSASRHVVVIAPGMGGILAHTPVSDGSDALWNAFATQPFNNFGTAA